jgi:uncharacterized membrane protein (DUF373 family)
MEVPQRFNDRVLVWLERGDRGIYIMIAGALIFLLVAASLFAWIAFFRHVLEAPLKSIFALISETLVALIILEVLGTVINYIKVRTLRLEPFFYIGIIASIRRILVAEPHHGFTEEMGPADFQQYLWDIGINSVAIVLLTVSFFLFSRQQKTAP